MVDGTGTLLVKTFLDTMAARDLPAARAMLAPGFAMTFPGGAKFATLEELVAWAKPRYRWVKKKYERFDEAQGASGDTIVYCYGTLYGEWPDGTAFEGIRFIDRFAISGGKLADQQVWNDLAESRKKNPAMAPPRFREIASVSNPLVKELRALHARKTRAETGLFLAEGARTVGAALAHGIVPERLAYRADRRDEPAIAALLRASGEAGAELLEVSASVLEKISQQDNPQSVVGVFRQFLRPLAELDPAAAPIWLALEGVRDPGNLGTCVRTADAVGAGGVILIGNTCDPFGPEAVRATMDSIFAVPIYAAEPQEALDFLRAWPGTTAGTALQTDTDYRDAAYAAPTLIVAGTEQSGLSDSMRDACRALVKLPMRRGVDSLNLSVAAGVMLYAVRERLDGR